MTDVSVLSDVYRQAAYMEVAGIPQGKIAEKIGRTPSRLSVVRGTEEYKVFIAGVRREVREKITDNAALLVEDFNQEARPAFDTLQEMHKGAQTEAVRVSAANSILDRAPDAPKIVKNNAQIDARTIIQLPVKTAESMVDTLKMVGAGEIVDLYEEAGEFRVSEEEDRAVELVTLEELEESVAGA